MACRRLISLTFFFKLDNRALSFVQCLPRFFHTMNFGSSEHSGGKVYEYTLRLGLVGFPAV